MTQEAPRPAYCWWPWRTLAIAVPVVAVGTAGLVVATAEVNDGEARELAAIQGLLTLFAGGNALLLGAAIGDMGKTMLVFMATVFAALVCTALPGALALFLGPFVAITVMCATLSVRWRADEIVAAMFAGWYALFLGGAFGFGVFAVLVIPAASTRSEPLMVICLALACAVGNLVFVGKLFGSAYRVQGSVPGVVLDEAASAEDGPAAEEGSLPEPEKNSG